MLNSKALAASASAPKVYIEECFQSWLYTGNGSTQTITNGIDLSGKGGLVWTKGRSGATNHRLVDTARGATQSLTSNGTTGELEELTGVTSFSSTGYSLGADTDYNTNAATYASWTFRKAAKFFDVVTYTGNGTSQDIAHSLGSTPGCVIIKPTSYSDNWTVWHRSAASPAWTRKLYLNTTSAVIGASSEFNSKDPTSTVFSVGSDFSTNGSGQTFVAYLFAHDAGGFGDSGNDSVVSCGSFTTNGSGVGTAVTLGWEPQWVVYKSTVGSSAWKIVDTMRGIPTGGNDAVLSTNNSNAENSNSNEIDVSAAGFQMVGNVNLNDTYIYIAIRRGPMKTPTDATGVFDAEALATSSGRKDVNVGFPLDHMILRSRLGSREWYFSARLIGGSKYLDSSSTVAEQTGFFYFDDPTGFSGQGMTSESRVQYSFRRAPGYMDVVAYTGTGSARTVSHNLGVVPELMIVKKRSASDDWCVYHKNLTNIGYTVPANEALAFLQDTAGGYQVTTAWNSTTPGSTSFSLGTYTRVNASGATFIAYLFATCPGVSKCFSFTGNGTSQTIDCGFTAGAKFVLIKRTDSTGNWLVADTARGIVSGNDPLLYLNSTAAEITTLDWIDPDNSGFIVNQESTANANVNGATYIGLAIA